MLSVNNEEPETLNRRRLVRTIGAGAVAAGLAGCSEVSQQSYEFSAAPVTLSESTRSEQGYSEESRQTVTTRRTLSVGGVEAEVTIDSEVATYSSERDTEPLAHRKLWAEGGGALASWAESRPVGSVQASEVVEGESLTARTGGGSIPASAAHLWAATPGSAPKSPGDVLVALPATAPGKDTQYTTERTSYAFDAGFFPPGTALDFESGLFIAGREED